MHKNIFKKTALSLCVSGLILASHAHSRNLDVTGPIKGARPEIKAVEVQGTLKVGSSLKIPDYYLKDAEKFTEDNVVDSDQDIPLSIPELTGLIANSTGIDFEFIKPELKNHIEWFLVLDSYDNNVTGIKSNWLSSEEFEQVKEASQVIPLDGSDYTIEDKTIKLPNLNGQQEITLPAIALGKRVGFKITARTATGFPIEAEPVYVMNAFLGDNTDGPTDPEEGGPDGTVDIWNSKIVIQTRLRGSNEDWVTIYSENNNYKVEEGIITKDMYSVVNREFKAMIFDEDGRSLDHLYQSTDAFSWRFDIKVGDIYNGKAVTQADIDSGTYEEVLMSQFNNYQKDASGDYNLFQIQDVNANANLQSFIDQGLRLTIEINDEKADVNNANPDEASPISAIEP